MRACLTREADSNYVYLWWVAGEPEVDLLHAVTPNHFGSTDTDNEYGAGSDDADGAPTLIAASVVRCGEASPVSVVTLTAI